MSGFCGELSLSPSRPGAAIDRMDMAMVDWGRDHVGQFREGPLALASRVRDVGPRAGMASAASAVAQPLVMADVVAAGHIRLDGREALGRQLKYDSAVVSGMSDLQLVVQAWRQWGANCAQCLYGDWVCAIYDRQKQSLWIGRDACGNTCLYYWQDPQRFVFSTSLKAVLAHPAVPRAPDSYWTARRLVSMPDREGLGDTAYADVFQLPGGFTLCQTGRGFDRRAWWHPESLAEIDWVTEEEYDRGFRQLYEQAVIDRLRNAPAPISIALSAGLDSGSVAAFAAPHLAERGQRLHAFTSVPWLRPDGAGARRLGDEGAMAQATAEHIGNIDFTALDSASRGLLASIEEKLEIHVQPGHAASNAHWLLDIMTSVRESGGQVLLTGHGGNMSVSWAGTGYAVRSDWRAFASSLWPFRRAHMVAATKAVLTPAVFAARRAAAAWTARQGLPWIAYSAIHSDLSELVRLEERIRKAGHDATFRSAPAPRSPEATQFRLARWWSGPQASWMELGAAFGVDVRDPTLDRRLVEFCWRVPDRVFWARGAGRGLITRGMKGALPTAVLASRRKGLQGADVGHRVRREQRQLREALDRIERHPLASRWTSVPRMRHALASVAREVTPQTNAEAGAVLLRGIGVGLFLTRF